MSEEKNTSDRWSMFSDSELSVHHIGKEELEETRTSNTCLTFFNLFKTYFGIANLSYAKFLADSGVITGLIGIVIAVSINIYSVWLLTKARNRFKHEKIVSLADLGVKLYGESAELPVIIIQQLGALMFLLAYNKFFGQQLD